MKREIETALKSCGYVSWEIIIWRSRVRVDEPKIQA
jgi:hypothetical protein